MKYGLAVNYKTGCLIIRRFSSADEAHLWLCDFDGDLIGFARAVYNSLSELWNRLRCGGWEEDERYE